MKETIRVVEQQDEAFSVEVDGAAAGSVHRRPDGLTWEVWPPAFRVWTLEEGVAWLVARARGDEPPPVELPPSWWEETPPDAPRYQERWWERGSQLPR